MPGESFVGDLIILSALITWNSSRKKGFSLSTIWVA